MSFINQQCAFLALLLTGAGTVDALLVERSFGGDSQQTEVMLSIEATEADLPYALEERLPEGLVAYDISAGGNFDERNGEVKWGPVTSSGQLTLSYFIGGVTGSFTVGGEAIGGMGSTSIPAETFSVSSGDFWRPNSVFLADGWLENDWFGQIWWPLEDENWLFHETHGHLYYSPQQNQDDVFFLDPKLDWVYSGRTVYPWIYAYNGLGWLLYLPGTTAPRWFWSQNEWQWMDETQFVGSGFTSH